MHVSCLFNLYPCNCNGKHEHVFISYVFPVRFLHKLLASFHFLWFLIHLILVITFIPLKLKDPPLPKIVLANSYIFQFSGQKSTGQGVATGAQKSVFFSKLTWVNKVSARWVALQNSISSVNFRFISFKIESKMNLSKSNQE